MIRSIFKGIFTATLGASLMGCSIGGEVSGGTKSQDHGQSFLAAENSMLNEVVDNIRFDLADVGVNGSLSVVPKGIDLNSLVDFSPGLINFSNIQETRARNGVVVLPESPRNITSIVSSLGLVNWRENFVDMRIYRSIKMTQEAWDRIVADTNKYISFIEIVELPSGGDYPDESLAPMSIYTEIDGVKIHYAFEGRGKESNLSNIDYGSQVYSALITELSKLNEQ